MLFADLYWTNVMTPKTGLNNVAIRRLAPGDDQQFSEMLDLFAEAFDDPENYSSARPPADYRRALQRPLDDSEVEVIEAMLRKSGSKCARFFPQ